MQHMIPNITEAMERAASRESDKLQSSLALLSITVMVGPFLGLLGTVQGVLVTFLSLRGSQIPTLQTIAPGISDALMTTVMGLLVAIPGRAVLQLLRRPGARPRGRDGPVRVRADRHHAPGDSRVPGRRAQAPVKKRPIRSSPR